MTNGLIPIIEFVETRNSHCSDLENVIHSNVLVWIKLTQEMVPFIQCLEGCYPESIYW